MEFSLCTIDSKDICASRALCFLGALTLYVKSQTLYRNKQSGSQKENVPELLQMMRLHFGVFGASLVSFVDWRPKEKSVGLTGPSIRQLLFDQSYRIARIGFDAAARPGRQPAHAHGGQQCHHPRWRRASRRGLRELSASQARQHPIKRQSE